VPDGYLEVVGVKAAEDDTSFILDFLKTDKNEAERGLQIHCLTPDQERLGHFKTGSFIDSYPNKVLRDKKNMNVTRSTKYSLNNVDGYLFDFNGYSNKMAMDTSCRQIVILDRSGKTLIFLTASTEISSYNLYEKEFEDFFKSFRQ